MFRRIPAALASFVVFAALVTVPLVGGTPAAEAAADDNFSLTKSDSVGGEALIGENVTYTLTASGTQSSAAYLYNLSFRDVLPAGVSFVSADPAPTAILSDVPTAGQTTLIWENTSDLPAASNASVSYTIDTNPDFAGGTSGSGTVPVGATVPNSAQAVASLNAFLIPDWSPTTGAFTGDFDGEASATNSLNVIAFRVTKSGPGELLRGVHDNGFGGRSGSAGDTFTIEIRNNPDYATNSVSLLDVLDPQLEFLGCASYYPLGDDNSTDVPFRESAAAPDEEWAGSGQMATGAGTCTTPTSVDTVDAGIGGGLANTEVLWDLGNLAPNDVVTVQYLAGIPMRANTTTWTTVGGQPTAASLDQGRNLDNNSGPSTNELDRTLNADPELLTDGAPAIANTATASGTYTPSGAVATDTDILQTEAEDIIITKSAAGTLNHGAVISNQLTVTTGEYRDFTSLVVRDLLPSALCYTGGFGSDNTPGGSDWNSNDCSGAGSGAGSSTSVREIAAGGPYGTGRFEIVWDQTSVPGLADLDSDSSITIGYDAVVRTDYRGGLARLTAEPVLAGDSVTNVAEVSGPDFVVAAHVNDGGADDEADGGIDGDTTSASLSNSLPNINKRISAKAGPLATGSNVTGAVCGASYGSITWQDTVATGFGPGEIVCFELGASFPSTIDYENVVIQDLLPPGYTYVAGSAARIASIDDLPGTTFDATTLRWNLGTVNNPGHQFRWVIAVQIGVPDDGVALDINANLQKMTHNQSAGTVFQYRDEVPAEWTEPQLDLAKGVQNVDAPDNTLDLGPNGIDFDGSTTGGSTSVQVQADAVVTFRVDVSNDGNEPALAVEVWDRIPTGFTCTNVSAISAGGSCSAGLISWTVPTITSATPAQLTYDLTVPADVVADESWTNEAGVRTYQAALNSDTAADSDPNTNGGRYDYYPRNNIDPTVTSNTDDADDVAFMFTAAPSLAKAQASGISEAGNPSNGTPAAGLDRATIGEINQYELQLTIPDGTAVYSGVLSDFLPTGLTYFEGLAAFGGSDQVLTPTVVSTDSDVDGDALGGGTLSTPAVGSGGALVYTLPADYRNPAGSGDDTVTVTFYVQVASGAAGTTRNNRGRFDWDDLGGTAQTRVDSNNARLRLVEPSPSVTKSHTSPVGNNVAPGDTITYRIDVANASGSNRSVLHDVTVVDDVPIGTTPLQAGGVPAIADGDLIPSTGISPAGSFNGVWSQTNRQITWTPSNWAPLVSLDPGVTRSFTYQTAVDDPATASGTLLNTASITGSNLATADPNFADGRTYNDSDTDLVNLPAATIVKDIEPLPSDSTDRATVTIGEPLDFDIEITLPANTRAYDLTLFDQLPAGITFDSFGTPALGGACSVIPGLGALAAGDIETFGPGVGGDSSRIAWFLGDVLANGSTCTITVPYTVHVDQNAADGNTLDNSATLVWNNTDEVPDQSPPSLPAGYDDPTSSSWDISDGPDVESILVVEPQLELDKDVTYASGATLGPCDSTAGNNRFGANDTDTAAGLTNGCDVESGDQLRYTLTVTNSGTSGANDTTVVDTLPVGFEPLVAPGGAIAANGATIVGASGSAGIWNTTNRTITWTITGPIAPTGGAVTLDYDVQLDPSASLTQGQDLTNTADIGTYFGLDLATRTAITNPDVPTYGNAPAATRGALLPDVVTVEVQFPELQITKTAIDDATDARFDQPFEWLIQVENIAPSASAFNVDVRDLLPAGWTYVANSALVTTPFGGPTQIEPAIFASNLTWDNAVSGPAQPLGPGETITITLDAVPEAALLAPDVPTAITNTGPANLHTNSAVVTGEDSSGALGCCDTGAGIVSYTDSDSADAIVRRVDLEVSKAIVDSAPIYFGDIVTYVVDVTNQGPSDATAVTLTDVFAPGHAYLSTTSIDAGTFTPGTSTWDIGTLASGATVQLVIQLEVNAVGPITNTAQITTTDQWDVDSTPDNDVELEDDQETVTITGLDTDLGNRVWLDLNADGVQDGSEPGIPGVNVYVSWTDVNSVVQVRSTVTDSDGNWNVSGLPANRPITVTVDPSNLAAPAGTGGAGSTLPAGLSPTWELADNPIITNPQAGNGQSTGLDHETAGVILTTANNSYVDVDFGYVGINSVGDEVWFDADAGGEPSPEPGDVALVGVDMTLTWAGFDGTFATADDLVFSDTTDGSGNYLFSGLPDGQYRVDVTPGTLPMGEVPTYDLDGVGSAHTSGNFNLGVGQTAPEDRTDVDFAYSATGTLGDTVWVDVNRDGVFDANEVPLGGIRVTATFTLPGGLVVNLETTTAPDGTYQFTDLPFDLPVTVAVDVSTLPPGLVQTYDLDGLATPDTAVATLTQAVPVRNNLDFGYTGDGEIGDLVWLDADASATPTQDAGEPGLGGVGVTLTWTNPTGGADMVLTTVTDGSGAYLFENLPPGDYNVAVAGLPAGTTPTFDADGGNDLMSDLTLTAGESNRDQDFSVTGTGSLGDTVWRDTNANGVFEAGESPIEGVDIEITWTDSATSSTYTWTETTDASGNYTVGNLPAGSYTGTVIASTLPPGYVATFDLDGANDGTATLILGSGEDRVDLDFGYRPEADLAVVKSHIGDFRLGEQNVWSIAVANNGPASAVAPVTVVDVLPSTVNFVSAGGPDWDCTEASGTVTCTYVGSGGVPIDMANGANSGFTITVEPTRAAAPSILNTVAVTSPTDDPEQENNFSFDLTRVPLAELELEKALNGNLEAGENAVYTITVTNTGPSASNGTITVTDVLPAGLTFVSANAPAGVSCSASGQTVTCVSDASLAVDATFAVELTVRVMALEGLAIDNVAVSSGGNRVNDAPLSPLLVPGLTQSANETATVGVNILAFTGMNGALMLGGALLLVGLGSLILLGRRRVLAPVRSN